MKMKFARRAFPMLIAQSVLAAHHAFAVTDTVEEGKRLYHMSCAMCHGAELKAAGGIPDLRNTLLDDRAFQSVVSNGRPGTIMPAMKNNLNDEEIRKILMYVRAAAAR